MQGKLPLKSLSEMSNIRRMVLHTHILKPIGQCFTLWEHVLFKTWKKLPHCVKVNRTYFKATNEYQNQLLNPKSCEQAWYIWRLADVFNSVCYKQYCWLRFLIFLDGFQAKFFCSVPPFCLPESGVSGVGANFDRKSSAAHFFPVQLIEGCAGDLFKQLTHFPICPNSLLTRPGSVSKNIPNHIQR